MESENSYNYLLYLLLRRTAGAVNKLRDKELEAMGSTARKSAVLRAVLRMGDEATITRISKQLLLEDHTVSEQIQRMVKGGLLKKERDADENTVRISVTDKGYGMYLKTRAQESVEEIMSVLTKREKKQLWTVLSKMRGKAVKELGIRNPELFPPADYGDLQTDATPDGIKSEEGKTARKTQ